MGDVGEFIKLYTEQGMYGSVEIGAVMAWRIIKKELPHLKVVLIRRPLIDVYNSYAQKGFVADLSEIAEVDAMLDSMSEEKGVYSLNYSDLMAPIACKWLFEHCLELEFDFDWWAYLDSLNIQMDLHDVAAMKETLDKKRLSFRADVLERMKGIDVSCLH
jgi:hypothetical protein